MLFKVLAEFCLEAASHYGLHGYDGKVIDVKPDVDQRKRVAIGNVHGALQQDVMQNTGPNVHQDLEIMLHRVDRFIEFNQLQSQYMLPYNDIDRTMSQLCPSLFTLCHSASTIRLPYRLQDRIDSLEHVAACD